MDTFSIIVISIAAIILVLSLTWIGLTAKKNVVPVANLVPVSVCPDYWRVNITKPNECIVPAHNLKNSGNRASASAKITYKNISYSSGESIPFTNESGVILNSDKCELKKWADSTNIAWDGITNRPVCG